MELRHLRYFVAVAEELNFRKASDRLHVTQPALSRQVKDLEADVGVRLLDRDTGGVRLTDAGAAFLIESRLTLAQSEHAITVAREATSGVRGRITVGYLAPLLTGFMPPTIKAFNAAYPRVDIAMVELSNADQIAALESNTIQAGFGVRESAGPLPDGLEATVIARTPFRAVVGRSHRLAKAAKVPLAELIREPLLALAFRKGTAPHVEAMRKIFSGRGFKVPSIRAIEGAETFLATIESGMGVSLMGETGGRSRSTGLLFKPLKETGADLMIELRVVSRNGEASQLVKNFITVLLKVSTLGKTGPAKTSLRS